MPDAVPDRTFVPDRSLATLAGAAGGVAADAATLAEWGYRLYGGRILPPVRAVELATEVAPDWSCLGRSSNSEFSGARSYERNILNLANDEIVSVRLARVAPT